MLRDSPAQSAHSGRCSQNLASQTNPWIPELFRKSPHNPHVAGRLNISERQIATIRGWPCSFDLLGALIQKVVRAFTLYVVKRAASDAIGRGKETPAISRPS